MLRIESDHAATGTLLVAGAAEEGSSLTASIPDAGDIDGGVVGTAFQWQQWSDGAWADLAGASGPTLAIPADQTYVNMQVRVVATTTDALGGTTEFIGAGQTIANVDDEAIGALSVSGSAVPGGTLSATLAGGIDGDGAVVATSYQWQQNLVGTWTDILGANATTFAIASDSSYVGTEVRVLATTFDALGGSTPIASTAQTVTVIPDITRIGTAGADRHVAHAFLIHQPSVLGAPLSQLF